MNRTVRLVTAAVVLALAPFRILADDLLLLSPAAIVLFFNDTRAAEKEKSGPFFRRGREFAPAVFSPFSRAILRSCAIFMRQYTRLSGPFRADG
jgi:hypothetical protein